MAGWRDASNWGDYGIAWERFWRSATGRRLKAKAARPNVPDGLPYEDRWTLDVWADSGPKEESV